MTIDSSKLQKVPASRIEIRISGMTCASCASRIEKRLNKIEGVSASVNFATEKASLSLPEDVSADQILKVVESSGYTVELIHRVPRVEEVGLAPLTQPAKVLKTGEPYRVELKISGMTCASCASRIEKRLNKIEGVSASVNFATSTASLKVPPSFDTRKLIEVLKDTGYQATLRVSESTRPDKVAVDNSRQANPVKTRLIISLILAIPVVTLSMVYPWQFDHWQWLVLALASPVAVWGAWPFHRAAIINLRHGVATMDSLISLGVTAAFLWSLWSLFFGSAGEEGMRMTFSFLGSNGHEIYLEVASAVTVFILAGRYFEQKAKRESASALRALLKLGAKRATRLEGEVEVEVAVDKLAVGDRIIIRPGEKIAADARIVEGVSEVDLSIITGESRPVRVGVGEKIVGATINLSSRLVAVIEGVGANTELARMTRLVEEAQVGKARVQRLADRISGVFVPVVVALAIVTLVLHWIFAADISNAFTAAVAVLIIACPCALGLATPTALLVGTGRGSQLGILIRGVEVLESTRRIDTIVLDKTGTITTGKMTLNQIIAVDGQDEEEVLFLAASLEAGSEHPVGRAIVTSARASGIRLGAIEDFSSYAGLGVYGVVDSHLVVVGRHEWLQKQWSLPLSKDLELRLNSEQARGQTVVGVAWDGEIRGLLAVGDALKTTSRSGVELLKKLGLKPMLVTGDNLPTARAIARLVGIEELRAGVSPAGKLRLIQSLQKQGRGVAMVGDGVNDAAALAAADVGIAMGSGTDVAIAAADLTVISDNLVTAGDSIRLSRRTLRVIKGNLFWAFAYNAAALPVAMLGLLNPMLAGLAMALSSVFVVSNSLRLKSFKPAKSTS